MMTFHEVFDRLAAIDNTAVSVLKAVGFSPTGGIGGSVRPLRDPAEDIFLRGQTENMLDSLQLFHEDFHYLTTPLCGEYRLEPFPGGRYGFFDKSGRPYSLTCGCTIEAKLHDHYGRLCWIKCRLEHDGSDYYLWGHSDIPLAGLTVRTREVAL